MAERITLKETLHAIKGDFPSKSLPSMVKLYLYNPGFRLLMTHRIGKYLYNSRFLLLRQVGNLYKVRTILKRGCDISNRANIGRNVRFPHPLGVVIGEGVVIKENVKIWQHVTIGSHGKRGSTLSYPVIESNVKIYAGATVIGGVTIGENAVIGANAVVNIDVPAESVAVGIPCRILGASK